jgi:hypothetical protein
LRCECSEKCKADDRNGIAHFLVDAEPARRKKICKYR